MLRMLEISRTVPYKDMNLCLTVHWEITSDDRMENKCFSHVFGLFSLFFSYQHKTGFTTHVSSVIM